MATSSAGPQDVLKLWVSIPTRALMKRYQRAQSCDKTAASAVCTAYKHFLTLKILAQDLRLSVHKTIVHTRPYHKTVL